jgi:hypothetical protein
MTNIIAQGHSCRLKFRCEPHLAVFNMFQNSKPKVSITDHNTYLTQRIYCLLTTSLPSLCLAFLYKQGNAPSLPLLARQG